MLFTRVNPSHSETHDFAKRAPAFDVKPARATMRDPVIAEIQDAAGIRLSLDKTGGTKICTIIRTLVERDIPTDTHPCIQRGNMAERKSQSHGIV